MVELLKHYKSGFSFNSEIELNEFTGYCLNVVNNYICSLISRGKLFLPAHINSKDAAVDLIANLFTKENNCLKKFNSYFCSLEKNILTEEDLRTHIKNFLHNTVNNNLRNFYAGIDPETHRIIRSLNYFLNKNNYFSSGYLCDRYIHRKPVDFSNVVLINRDEFVNFMNPKLDCSRINTVRKYIELVFDSLEDQNDFSPAAAFSDLVFLYKSFVDNKYCENLIPDEIDSCVHYKMIIESVISKYDKKLDEYFLKKNIPCDEREIIGKIKDEYINNLINGGINVSVKKLTEKYFPDDGIDKYYNKIEYCLKLLKKDIIKEIRLSDKIGSILLYFYVNSAPLFEIPL